MSASRASSVIVIGGGFFGCYLASYLKNYFEQVTLLEESDTLLSRASYSNQARVHSGYHYPRSALTALRSKANAPRFKGEFGFAINDQFEKYYAVSREHSHISAAQFRKLFQRLGLPLTTAPARVTRLFDMRTIEEVFAVEECAFDATRLREFYVDHLSKRKVDLRLRARAARVRNSGPEDLLVDVVSGATGESSELEARYVFNCTYSGINQLLESSGLNRADLRHELTEMCLIEVPEELKNLGITVMCGPFFSCMPFPAAGLHSLSHVRYTPHFSWSDRSEKLQSPSDLLAANPRISNFEKMIRDSARYMPGILDSKHIKSLWEVKTLLPTSDFSSSRPILFSPSAEVPSLISVLGGKIDNVYDLEPAIDALFAIRDPQLLKEIV
jgi:glycine/D-amino acid oxidase-like deaminating enzyme